MNINIEVNNRQIQARKGETILTALNRNGIKVPTLCNMKDLSPTGACRLCVVEVEGKENLVTSCSQFVEESMKIRTHSPRVVRARKTLVELLLANHPDDCLYCDRNENCELQSLAAELHIRERKVQRRNLSQKLDLSSPSIVRDPAKCILCGRCVRVCDEVQSVATFEFVKRGCNMYIGSTMSRDLNFSSCIGCGQCVLACPTSALSEHSNIDEVIDSLNNPSLIPVVQFAPSIPVSLAEEFGMKTGKDLNGILNAALKKMGFRYVFDTSVAADLAIMELASELLKRKESGENMPIISSCCPAWVKFMEQFYPNHLNLLSTSKSPQQILGSLIKSYFAPQKNINPSSIYSVSIMPCLAKKFEAQREEMTSKGVSDVDTVLSTRELARLIKLHGIDIQNIDSQNADAPFNIRSSAGKLFGVAGGTAEGLMRTLHHTITGRDLQNFKVSDFRSNTNIREVKFTAGDKEFIFIVISGLKDIHKFMDELNAGYIKADYIEVMACPGGCVNGGGQPFASEDKDIRLRARSIYEIDEVDIIRCSYKNQQVQEIYSTYLGEPGSDLAKRLLHTTFVKRDVLL
ncbi:MAG: [FeFe] hydrogenase, group A [Bacteroidales bacterium]